MSSIRCLLALFYWILLSHHTSGQAVGRPGTMKLRKLGTSYTSPWMEEILDEKKMEHYWSESLEMSMSMSMSFPLPAYGKAHKLRA